MKAGELVVRAQAEQQLLQHIPHEKLAGDFPDSLVFDYAHWLNLENGILEFRPLEQTWKPNRSNWHLSFRDADDATSIMTQGHRTLIDTRSPIFQGLAEIFRVLDAPGHMHVMQTENDAKRVVEIYLVRLRLKFFITVDGGLKCQEINAIVDRNQDIGCLYGLQNKLVLLDTGGSGCRSVLIPYGSAQLFKTRHQTAVSIELPQEPRLKCFHYSFDRHLQMLRGEHDMLETLYLAYMHAVTSYVLPDPATGRSGTAEAIRILQQAWLKPSFPLDTELVAILKRIAALTPERRYYPGHLKSMQTVTWNSELGQLAQHDDFRALTQEIVEHASRFNIFHGVSDAERDATVECYEDCGDHHLLERARFRHSQFRCPEFGGSAICQMPEPTLYAARDRDTRSDRSLRVYKVATLVRNWRSFVPHCHALLESVRSWKCVRPSGLSVRDLSCSELLKLSFEDAWGSLYELCRSSDQARDLYSLMSLFCTIAFAGKEEPHIYPLLAVAFSGQFEDLPVPGDQNPQQLLDLQLGEDIDCSKIKEAIERSYNQFRHPVLGESSKRQKKEARELRAAYDLQKESDITSCLEAIRGQWPCKTPQLPKIQRMDQRGASQGCAFLCTKWYQNRQFFAFLRQVQNRLSAVQDEGHEFNIDAPPSKPRDSFHTTVRFSPPSLLDILSSSSPITLPAGSPPLKFFRPRTPQCYNVSLNSELRSLVGTFRNDPDSCRRELGEGLEESLEALEGAELPCSSNSMPVGRNVLVQYRTHLESQRDIIWEMIKKCLRATKTCWEEVAGMVFRPDITVHSLLSLLAADRWQLVPEAWRYNLSAFARSIASVRRCDRLLACFDRADIDGFFKEAENVGGEGWDPYMQSDWLLFEVENNLTIRKQQSEVASKMIKPEVPGNSVLQLNMGEGKTAVIIPATALTLADGTHLLRIFVLKPLLRQSMNLLSQRLGGMLNRLIYHIPFSRDTPLDERLLRQLWAMYIDCQKQRGILIVLPEQVLSFRLVGLDLMSKTPALAHQVIELEEWLQSNCRNVIDESDEILDPKFQLVYTVGSQQTMDGHSDRWEITQALFALVEEQTEKLHLEAPSCLDIERSGARYPIFHFLTSKTADTIIEKIVEAIGEEGLPGIPINQWTRRVRRSALDFIRFADTTNGCRNVLRDAFEGGDFMRKLLVLRGLLAHHILKFALAGKRWLVDYGLHPYRCLMAVPFRAKGIPSENAEFGHPDVAISLTCLSYYYQGLNSEQVRHCFALLGKENDPSAEYQNWISRRLDTLPSALRAMTGVNLEDARTFREILYPHLQHQKGIIDFYLSQVVFPREAKEFPQKLCASAWDLPSRLNQPLTTGFSGTNDNRLLLPRSTPQRDLPHLLLTNAMVLGYILQEENRACVLAQDERGCQLPAFQLVDLIQRQDAPVRVIIDVGAQILESRNQHVAQHWLSLTAFDDADAAVFYDEDDEASVIDREGHIERLLCSPFRQRMHRCLVFLDQQHARGVDLKLPSTFRAAVTIGPRLTKDRLVQGK
jgi:hypothetical protein